MSLEEYDHQMEANDHLFDELSKGNRDLLQQAHSLEWNDELLRMYRKLQGRSRSLNNTRT
jgi:hypothetical protein